MKKNLLFFVVILLIMQHGYAQQASISKTDVTCNGLCDGTATASAPGACFYQWNVYSPIWGYATDNKVTDLCPGTYKVTVTNPGAFTNILSVTIIQPAPIQPNIIVTSPVTCAGYNDGALQAQTMGGTGTYTYVWSNNAISQNISGIAAGTYILTVTDANTCEATTTAIITEPAPLTINTTTKVSSGNNGTVTATVNGGTPPYIYSWSNGKTDGSISGLTSGTYYITATDAHNCTIKDTAVVSSNVGIAQFSDENMWQALAPNPFSENTIFTYVFPKSIKTAFLRIYDIKGVLIHSYSLSPEESTLNISASDFENGVYLYGIETNGITTAKKKIVVVKY